MKIIQIIMEYFIMEYLNITNCFKLKIYCVV